MSGKQLKDELARVAEGAPEVHVPDDLFTRGRRATARARVLVGAAAVACLAVVAAVTVPLLRTDEAGVADGGELGGVPDVIYAPTDGRPPDLPMVALDELGQVVAAYVDGHEGRLVVIRTDGSYRLIELDDLFEPMLSEVLPRLSPDGRKLAYAADTGRSHQIGILDFATGQTLYVELGPPLGAGLRSLQWSPDSEWLVWSGQPVSSRRQNGASYHQRLVGGVIGPDTRNRALPHKKSGWDGAGVCNDGSVVTYVWPIFTVFKDNQEERTRSWRRVLNDRDDCSAPEALLDAAGRAPQAKLLGWLATEDDVEGPTAVVLAPEDDGSYGPATIELVPSDAGPTDVGAVASVTAGGVTVATGLMSREQPTVPAGEDPFEGSWWQRHRDDVFITAFLVAAPCLLLLFIPRRLRR